MHNVFHYLSQAHVICAVASIFRVPISFNLRLEVDLSAISPRAQESSKNSQIRIPEKKKKVCSTMRNMNNVLVGNMTPMMSRTKYIFLVLE